MGRAGIWGASLLLFVGVGCGASCPEGQEMCDGVCADLSVDRNHCGTCGNACGQGEVCDGAGSCAVSCATGLSECSGACVDTDTDEAHCGSCGNACDAGEVCDGAGTCGVSCAAGLSECSGSCVDTDRDEAHCGSCGNACDPGELCDGAGACAPNCATGLTECSGSCVDTDADEAHCGACGETCDAGEACVDGACEATCGAGLLACDGACVDPMTSTAFCGATGDCAGTSAGTACGTNQACAGGACVDIHPCSLPSSGTPGVTVGAVSGPAEEGGDAVTYTLVLDAQPCDTVYVTLAPDAQLTVGESVVVFPRESWDVAQTVSVRAVADPTREGDHTGTISHAVASGDSAYDAITVADVTVAIVDTARLWHASLSTMSGPDGDASLGAVSAAGVVAFVSSAENLVAGDTNGVADAFTFDVATGRIQRWSVAADGTEADGASLEAVISDDGSVVAFFAHATNLTSTPVTTSGEFFRVGRSGTPAIGQITPTCPGCSQEMSAALAISANGSAIAYTTRRAYDSTDTDGEYDLYVWNESTGTLSLESLNSSDQNGSFFWGSNSFGPSLSATGQFAGFQSAARNLGTPELAVQNFHAYVKDRTGRGLTRVSLMDGGTANCDGSHQSSNSGGVQISADGNVAAFHSACVFTLSAGTDTNGVQDVLVRNISATSTTRVSVASDGTEANGASGVLGLSDDGNLVLFWSDATNLVVDDTNGARDLFVRDVAAGTTVRVSLGAGYEELAAGVVDGAMSRDGAFIAFVSAESLLPSDSDDSDDDVYLVRVR